MLTEVMGKGRTALDAINCVSAKMKGPECVYLTSIHSQVWGIGKHPGVGGSLFDDVQQKKGHRRLLGNRQNCRRKAFLQS